MKEELFLLDLPESEENDAIGYEVYVNNIINAINSNAKMIGLVSNYGSGKSTIINMVKNKEKTKNNRKFININLWKIKETDKQSRNSNTEDETIGIHKFLLKKLIAALPEKSNKDYFNKKIDDKYTLFNISMRNKNDIYWIFILLGFFFFNIIMKLDIVGFTVPRICIFIIDLTVSICLAYILSGAKLYLSFNKDKTNRKINESDTSECFNEIINEFLNKDSEYNQVIICIEDLDRYNDSDLVIRILEQIYKFYTENNDIDVKFIISLKPPYLLAKDSKKFIESKEQQKKEEVDKNIVNEYKELYEKLFDIIINLQTVSFQNYGSVLLELISHKEQKLSEIGINIPTNEDKIGMWNYLYKGRNVSIRDIKHRFNYFIILYENLYEHRKTLETPELIDINIETCLFVSYLEDEYSSDFYALVNNSQKFNDIVSEYLMKRTFSKMSDESSFDVELKKALEKGIVTADYSMYFYKYPKSKPIMNIFDNAIQNAIFLDSKKNISDFDLYCEKASKNIVMKAISEKCNQVEIPEIIFDNKILYDIAEDLYYEKILNYLETNFIFSVENGYKKVQKMLKKILDLKSTQLRKDYVDLLYNDLKNNYDDDQIIEYRKEIIKILDLNEELLTLYNYNMPLITIDEIKNCKSPDIIFSLISKEKTNEKIYEIIDFIVSKWEIKFNLLLDFFEKIKDIDKKIFKNIFYRFDFSIYNRSNLCMLYNKNYNALSLDNLKELKEFAEKVKILPLKKEKEIINYLNSLDENNKKNEESLYVEILNIVNNISSETIKYLPKLSYYYEHSEEIENQLFELKFYSRYCYSKFSRLNRIIYEEEKFEQLKPYYVSFFKNSKKVTDDYIIDLPILQYIKENIHYSELTYDKIKLLIKLPQKIEDFEVIYEKGYQNPNSDVLKDYLRNIVKIDDSDEKEFVENLIEEVKTGKLSLSKQSYSHIIKILKINNVRKLQKIKKLCKNL